MTFNNFEYMFKANLFFLASTLNPEQVYHQLVKDCTPSCICNWATGVFTNLFNIKLVSSCTPRNHKKNMSAEQVVLTDRTSLITMVKSLVV